MAELYLAKDTAAGRMVVLKRIVPYLAQEADFVKMFLDEARIAASLNHPNVVQLYELGQRDSTIFIAMEWVDGMDLRKVLMHEEERHSVVPPPIAAWVVARMCEGLHYAHMRASPEGVALGIIHRDVSPQNVMVSFRGEVKLVDFGIAKATAWMRTSRPGIIKGKFVYASPEQLSQEPLDARSDIFSVGTLLYELTTGKNPFRRPSPEGIILAVRHEEPPLPREIRPGYPVELSRIVLKCLQKDRARRYQTAQELSAGLDEFLAGCGPVTQPDVTRYLASLVDPDDERTTLDLSPIGTDEPAAREGIDRLSLHPGDLTVPIGSEAPNPDLKRSPRLPATLRSVPQPPPVSASTLDLTAQSARQGPAATGTPAAAPADPMDVSSTAPLEWKEPESLAKGPAEETPSGAGSSGELDDAGLEPTKREPDLPFITSSDIVELSGTITERGLPVPVRAEAHRPPAGPRPPTRTLVAEEPVPPPGPRRTQRSKGSARGPTPPRPTDFDDHINTMDLSGLEPAMPSVRRSLRGRYPRWFLWALVGLLGVLIASVAWLWPRWLHMAEPFLPSPPAGQANLVKLELRAPPGTAIEVDGVVVSAGAVVERSLGPCAIRYRCPKKNYPPGRSDHLNFEVTQDQVLDLPCH